MLRVKMALIFTPWAILMAQTPQNTGSNGAGNGNGGTSSGSTRVPAAAPPDSFKPLILSGRGLTSDGNFPPEGVAVQRVCGATVTAETHTDSKGRFTLQLSGYRTLVPDASSGAISRGGDSSGGGGRSGNTQGCDVRAVLQGYRSDVVPLSDRHSADDPSVGPIILHPLEKGRGLTMSATTGFAPKPARKSYEKGLEALRRNNPDDAQKDFLRAVDGYQKFAAAWFELGRVYERRSHDMEARHAYLQAVAADADYVSPYERLYLLEVKEARWQQAAEMSDKVLRLDPIEFPGAYYFNALANAKLNNLAAAERSAREAVKIQGAEAEPRAQYVLGLVLMEKGDFTGAAEALRDFLRVAAEGPDERAARRMLLQIEARAQAAQR